MTVEKSKDYEEQITKANNKLV